MRARPSEKEAAKCRNRCREEFLSVCMFLRIPSKILSEELAHHSEKPQPRLYRAYNLFYLALQKIVYRNHSIWHPARISSVRPARHRCLAWYPSTFKTSCNEIACKISWTVTWETLKILHYSIQDFFFKNFVRSGLLIRQNSEHFNFDLLSLV